MAILLAVAIGIILGLVQRGQLKGLAKHMRYPLLLVVSLLLEASTGFFVKALPTLFPKYLWMLVIVQYALIFSFFLLNARQWPVSIMALGTLLNFAVIISNGGRMPVAPVVYDIPAFARTVARIDSGAIPEYFIRSGKVPLWFLGDNIAIPLPGAGMGSIGDIFMMVGIALFIMICMTLDPPKHAKLPKGRRER